MPKINKILIFVFLGVLFTTLITFTMTKARYVKKYDINSNTDELEYTVANQIQINTAAELFAAINAGYPNIKISDGVENPIFVKGEVDVNSDLILDLNGHEIQRNDRTPMLTIKPGVKMMITDSSDSKKGSFYNPVGSVLKIEGGVLTVLEGTFESGPRKNEYLDTASNKSPNGGIIEFNVDGGDISYDTKHSEYKEKMKLIVPQIFTISNNVRYVDGNIYDAANDLFYYFSIDDDFADNTMISDPNHATFCYSYFLEKVVNADDSFTYKYIQGLTSSDANAKKVTIYGYENVKRSATNDVNYSTISMSGGALYTRGGDYNSYFGKSETYCVYTTGGVMNVLEGQYSAIEEGVCINCNINSQSDNSNLNSLIIEKGVFDCERGNAILVNSGNMYVGGGTFNKICTNTAYEKVGINSRGDTKLLNDFVVDQIFTNNSIINMENGNLTILGEQSTETNSKTIKFNAKGAGIIGINCKNGSTINAKYAEFKFDNDETDQSKFYNNIGICNQGGTITTDYCLFKMDNNHSIGIYSEKNDKNIQNTINSYSTVFSMSGDKAVGIKSTYGDINIGSEANIGVTGQDTYTMFYIDKSSGCFGVYADSINSTDSLNITLNASQIYLGHMPLGSSGSTTDIDSAGIYLNASGTSSVTVRRAVIYSAQSNSAGVWIKSGRFIQERFYNSTTTASDYKFAIFVGAKHMFYDTGGEYKETGATNIIKPANIDHYRYRYAKKWLIAQYGPGYYGMEFEKDGTGNTTDKVTNRTYNITQTNAQYSYGIYSEGGSIVADSLFIYQLAKNGDAIYSKGSNEIDINNFECSVSIENDNDIISASAIHTSGGTIKIQTSKVLSNQFGYLIDNGSLKFTYSSTEDESNDQNNVTKHNWLTTTSANAIYSLNNNSVTNGNFFLGKNSSLCIDSIIAAKSTNKLKLEGKNDSYNGNKMISPDAITWNSGTFTSNGDLKITFSGLYNDNQADNSFNPLINIIKSWAIRVKGIFTMKKCEILSNIGGGIRVEGSTTTVGSSSSNNSDIKIITNGSTAYDSRNGNTSNSNNWEYYVTRDGGDCLKVVSGNLIVYNGDFEAALGNGILVSGGSATIHNGKFMGGTQFNTRSYFSINNGAWVQSTPSVSENGSGLASYYGLKMWDGGSLTCNNGIFCGRNGGAFITGGIGTTKKAVANIDSGTFAATNVYNVNTGELGIQNNNESTSNGISFGENIEVTFGSSTSNTTGNLIIAGFACAIALEQDTSLNTNSSNPISNIKTVKLNIYKGNFYNFRSTPSTSWTGIIWIGNGVGGNEINIYGPCKFEGYSNAITANPAEGGSVSINDTSKNVIHINVSTSLTLNENNKSVNYTQLTYAYNTTKFVLEFVKK